MNAAFGAVICALGAWVFLVVVDAPLAAAVFALLARSRSSISPSSRAESVVGSPALELSTAGTALVDAHLPSADEPRSAPPAVHDSPSTPST